jgi:hypothetical protein
MHQVVVEQVAFLRGPPRISHRFGAVRELV